MTFSPTVDERQLKLVHFFPDKIAESATTRFAAKHRQRISKRISGRTEKVTGQQTTCVLPWVVAAAAEVRIIPRFRHLPAQSAKNLAAILIPAAPSTTGFSPGGRGGRGPPGGRGTFPILYSINPIPREDTRALD